MLGIKAYSEELSLKHIRGIDTGVTQKLQKIQVVSPFALGIMIGILAFVAACGRHAPSVLPPPTGAPARSGDSGDLFPEEYQIGPEDVLEVSVWKNADVSKVVTVRPDGIITLPLTGDIKVSGRTAEQVRSEVKRRLEQYMEVPEVWVTVADVRSYNLFILGEVKTPGKYQVKSHTTLLQAVALSGGFTAFANTDDIMVVRRSQRAGQQQRIRVKYSDLVKRGDIGLNPGDTVIVP